MHLSPKEIRSIFFLQHSCGRKPLAMQNSISSGPLSLSTLHSSTPRHLPGFQWKQHEALPSSVALGVPRGRHSDTLVVRAFFGGSKTPPVKSAGKGCFSCLGKGAVDCAGCKGTGKNKKNGNMFERWKCYDCQGFGMVSCPKCGKGGLTPEQRGER